MKRIILSLMVMALALPGAAQKYLDVRLSPEERATDLVSRLTLEEKASLMMNRSRPVERFGIGFYDWWNEALHGVTMGSATVFPEPMGMASSFDPELLYTVFVAISDEARAKQREDSYEGHFNGLTFWAPNINLYRDPRWGRGMETYGEDPYLSAQMGMSVVRGLQGEDNLGIRKLHACAKHYAVHSGPESKRHSMDINVSDRDLFETYLPAFKDIVTKTKVEEVMTAYTRFRGVPCGASPYLIDTLLRGRWGYKGLVVSDCSAVDDFWVEGHHGYSEDMYHAVATAVKAGMDVECGQNFIYIPGAVERGLLDESDIDRNLIRNLAARFALGEMDHINPWGITKDDIEGPGHKALDLEMAEESIVLLSNDGILPLKPEAKVALIGPNADDAKMMWGNYTPVPKQTFTLYQGMAKRNPELLSIRGCGRVGAEYLPEGCSPAFALNFTPALDVDSVLTSLGDIDTVVFAGGLCAELEGEQMNVDIPGFYGGDRTDIELPQVQRTLIAALHKAGKKVILVNFSGGAMGLVPEKKNCNAIIQAWYPGEMGGEALARILYGEVSPSGKLPVTFYKSASQLPDFESYDMKGRTYRFFRGKPAFAFGHGLAYSRLVYSRPRVEGGNVLVNVRNAGERDVTEVVQLYVRRIGDCKGPLKTLRGFSRVRIPAGETVQVELPLSEETFLWWSEADSDMVFLPGRYVLSVGGSSDKVRSVRIKVSEDVLSHVDPFIGTDYTGHTFPNASYPGGMVQAGPQTGNGSWKYCAGYNFSDSRIQGFTQNRLSGTGNTSLGNILVMPFSGEAPAREDYSSRFDRSTQAATPGYYHVDLIENAVGVDITSSPRAALYEFAFGGDGKNVLLDLRNCQTTGDWRRKGAVSYEGRFLKNGLTGKISYNSWVDYDLYFALEFDRDIVSSRNIVPDGAVPAYVLNLGGGAGPVKMKIGLSFTGEDEALANLRSEIPGWNFAKLRKAAESAWRKKLSVAEVRGTPEMKKAFYTSLYHLYLQPYDISDHGSAASYSTLSQWDTFRAADPFYAITDPGYTSELVNSMILEGEERGFLPIWDLNGKENYCMIANHSVPVVVDACLKDIPGVDAERAYAIVKKSLTVPHQGSEWDLYDKYGYLPYDKVYGESVSRVLEYGYDDYCAALLAGKLGYAQDSVFFMERSRNYRNLWDSGTGFFRARGSDGAFRTPFEPLRLVYGWLGGDYTEGNAWQYLWHVLQDPEDLFTLMGGPEAAGARLDEFLTMQVDESLTGSAADVTGLIGQYAHGNEPCHHVLYLYTLLGRQDTASEYIAQVCDNFYRTTPDGLCGNDDCGQMSAWYVFSAMGFYPVDPVSGDYVLGAPVVPEVKLHLPGGVLHVKANGFAPGARHVESVTFNGTPLDKTISWDVLRNGGELVFRMSR